MTYNPTMEGELCIWRGDRKQNVSKYAESPITTVSNGTPYLFTTHTTCRESLSRGIRSAMLLLGTNLPKGLLDAIGLHMSLKITVNKGINEEEAMSVLNSGANFLPGYPVLSGYTRDSSGYLTFIASEAFLYDGCPEGPLSFVMFFLNRLEHFPCSVMSSYKATDHAINAGVGNFISSSYILGYRFALWAVNKGLKLRWDIANKATSGVGEYTMYHVMPEMMSDTVHFMKELNISLEQFKNFTYFASLKEAYNSQW